MFQQLQGYPVIYTILHLFYLVYYTVLSIKMGPRTSKRWSNRILDDLKLFQTGFFYSTRFFWHLLSQNCANILKHSCSQSFFRFLKTTILKKKFEFLRNFSEWSWFMSWIVDQFWSRRWPMQRTALNLEVFKWCKGIFS